MVRYVVLIHWTDQGVRNAKDSVKRSKQSREAFQKIGVTIDTMYWTLGKYDLVALCSAPDDQTLAAGLLRLAGEGNVRTTTLRAFDENEVSSMLAKIA